MSAPVNFLLKLGLFVGLTFVGHLFILNALQLPLFHHLLIPAYLVNFALAYTIFMALFLLKKKFAASLGFLFIKQME